MTLHLTGWGTALPQHSISQRDAAQGALAVGCYSAEQARLLPVLYRRAGVQVRYSVVLESDDGPPIERQTFFHAATGPDDRGPTTASRMEAYDRQAAPLALAAARAALVDAGTSPDEVSHIITVSCSGFSAPGFDISLLRELPLRPTTSRTHIGFMGCHGALNALRVAQAFATSQPEACVLVCAVELCSLHHQYGWDPNQIVANALFADGAAAVVCRGRPRNETDWSVVDHGSTLLPDSTDAICWRIHDHGFEMELSPQVPELIQQQIGPWLRGWLAGHDLTIDAIGAWAVHPGGPRILSAAAEGLGLHVEQFRESQQVLQTLGNMSSPTVLFILDRLRQSNSPLPCVALGFGPGVALEAALIR